MSNPNEPMKFKEREKRIRAKAHELWEKEGRTEGHAEEHWERAAREIDRQIESESETGSDASRKTGADSHPNRSAPFSRYPEAERASDDRAELPERKPEDLDREDAAIQREGIAGEKPGIRPQGDADFVREKG